MAEGGSSCVQSGNIPSNQRPAHDPDDELLRYLLDPSSDSSPDNSPPLFYEDVSSESASDASPARWSTDTDATMLSIPPAPAQLSEIALDLDNDLLLYGSSYSAMSDIPFPFDNNSPATTCTSLPPAAPLPLIAATPTQSPTTPASTCISTPPCVPSPADLIKKASKSRKRPRNDQLAAVPPPPSPDQILLPRDTLLKISSQGMDRYVENLQSSRPLSLDEQKELKRQKRLIKNRESAQLSRERKRAYIDDLEQQIAQLVNENSQLRNENTMLRQALSQYQPVPPGLIPPKSEPTTTDIMTRPKAELMNQQAKITPNNLAGMINGAATIGGNRQSAIAKAGVCLLLVCLSFGLFMNTNNTASHTRLPYPSQVSFEDRSLLPKIKSPSSLKATVGFKRSLLEALPEVVDEDADEYDPIPVDFDKPKDLQELEHHHVPQAQPPFHVQPAGIFKVSYSVNPTNLLPSGKHQHSGDDSSRAGNNTYMLFLDPRPDLTEDDASETGPIQTASPAASSRSTDLSVPASTTFVKRVNLPDTGLPPMIISLVVPSSLANGSNPLLPPEGVSPQDSLVEVTCQVVDVSITTSERTSTRAAAMAQ